MKSLTNSCHVSLRSRVTLRSFLEKNYTQNLKEIKKIKLQKSRTICYNFTYLAATLQASKLNKMQAIELNLENCSCEKQEEKPVTLKDSAILQLC